MKEFWVEDWRVGEGETLLSLSLSLGRRMGGLWEAGQE